jgi:hypothetical protein
MFTRASYPVVKQLGREANNHAPSSGQVKNNWSYTPTPPYILSKTEIIRLKFSGRYGQWDEPYVAFH